MISIDSDKKGLEYCWKYPNDEFLSKCAETKPEILFDKRVLCRTLAAIIIHNSENNQQTSNRLKNSFATFWVAFLFAIFTMILVVVICNSIWAHDKFKITFTPYEVKNYPMISESFLVRRCIFLSGSRCCSVWFFAAWGRFPPLSSRFFWVPQATPLPQRCRSISL